MSTLNLNLPTLASSLVKSGATTTATTTAQQCYIHPVVLFSILDHFLRRNDNQERVIGTLLGVRSDDGRVIEIRNCFSVLHFETEDEVELDIKHHRAMFALHKRASAREQIVGWYATGSSLSKYAALIQDFYSREAAPFSAVHLVVDTDMSDGQLGIKCLQGSPVGAGAHPENCLFLPLPYELQYPDAELTALQAAADTTESGEGFSALVSDMEQLEKSIAELHGMLERVTTYVQNVCTGRSKANNIVGKYLMDMLAVVPTIDTEQFSRLFQTHLQDVLMVAYLTNLTRAQLNIADRLQRIV
ncbi:JAB1/Mov34/MPN/PAD-1 ubiquitin protease-domain-containing protein [Coemansia spiralis]|nr:JAB1/Mov34/MPN/PAD-1 ubiquitin protease-domain-containing protein [Coemansia spiralis]